MTSPMRFTVAPPGASLPLSPQQPRPSRLVVTRRGWIAPGAYGPVEAETADGVWLFRLAKDGTWMCGHLPTLTEVKTGIRSLTACRSYAGSGKAQADLGRIRVQTETEGRSQ